MSQKHGNASALLASTTGAGIAVGTNIAISTVFIGSVATTVTFVNSAGTTQFSLTQSLDIYPPVAIVGPVTATSSGGNFAVSFIPA